MLSGDVSDRPRNCFLIKMEVETSHMTKDALRHALYRELSQTALWKRETYEFIFVDDWKIGYLNDPSGLLQLTHSDTRFDVNYLNIHLQR